MLRPEFSNGQHAHETAQTELTSEIGRLRKWHFWSGPIYTALVGAALMGASIYFPSIRPGIMLSLLVLYSIFSGGLVSGLLAAGIAILALNFTYAPHTLLPAPQNLGYMAWHVGSLLLVLGVGERLRRSSYRARLADKLNRQLHFEIQERGRIERELRERNETFEDFVENGSIGMHWVGPEGTILWANQCELDFLGYSADEYIGHNIAEFHADPPVIADILERLGRDETLRNYEARLVCKDSTIKHVHINSNVRRKDGEFLHTRCFTRDITDLHERVLELTRKEGLFDSLATNLPAAIYTTDPAGVITFYNEKAVEAWGQRPVIGEDLWCGSWKIFRADGTPCPLDECPMAVALREQREVRGEEIVVERPDGTRLWLQPYPTPIFDEHGEMTGALNLLLDISDRKQIEQELREAQEDERRISAQLRQLSRISRILAESRSLEEASRDLLRTGCELTDAYTAALWLEDNGSLRCVEALAMGDGCEDFLEVTRNMVYKPGSGLPGRAIQSGNPVWVYDVAMDPNLPRKPYAERAGLGSAYAFPLRSGERITGVMEVYFKGKREYDEERLSAIAEAGTRIGIFIERQRAVQAMVDSEGRFRALFEQAGVGVVQADIEGNIITANDRYCEMVGNKLENLRGRRLLDFTHPDDRGKYVYQLGLLWAGDIERLNIEKRNITSDGRTIWISKTMSLVRDEHGEAKYTVAVVQDVTPRIEAQQVVREQQDYLRAVLQNSPVCLAAVDTEGAYRVFSGTALEKLGITAQDRLGKTFYEAQKDDPDVISWYQRALQGESFVERQVIQGQVFELAFAPHRDEQGTIIGAIALATDIGDRIRDEQALRASEERFRTLIYALPTAVYTTDADGVITMYNDKAAEIWGRHPELGIEKYCGSLKAFSADGRELSFEDGTMAQTLRTGKPVQGQEVSIERPDGSRVTVIPYPEPLLNSDGELIGAVNVLIDITERKQAEQRLLASEARLRTTLENAPLILTEINKDGIIEFVIGRGLADAGVEPNTNVGKSVYETNKDTPERLELFERAVRGEEVNYMLTQDGMAFNTFIGPRRGVDGEINGVIGVLTNMTDLYQTQLELRARDAVLQLVTDKAPIVLAQIDKDGKYLQFLGSVLEDIGVSAESRVDKTIQEIYPAEHPLRQVYDSAMQGDSREITFDLPDGRIFHVLSVPNRGSDGTITDMVMLGLDITARVEAERKLQRSEAFLTSLLDSAPFILTFMDTEGVIRLSMGSALTHKGFPVQDLVGKSVYTTYGSNPRHIELFNSALAGTSFRQPITLGDITYEVSARPYYDDQGQIAGVLSIALDVTDLKDTEDMLRERDSQLTAILENTPMVLGMIDARGVRKMIVGKLLDELQIDVTPLIGTSIFEDDSQPAEVVEAIRRTLEEGAATSFTTQARGKQFHVFVSPHLGPDGKPVGAVTAALDITDAYESEQELRRAKAELEEWQLMVNTLLGTAPVGVALLDADCRYLYINDYLAELNGAAATEHIGRRAHEIIPPEVADYMAALVRQVYDSGQPQLGIESRAESPKYPGELRDFEGSLYPLTTADGRRIGVGAIVADMTEYKRAKAAANQGGVLETV